jgi:homocysteine S-methyltransferase
MDAYEPRGSWQLPLRALASYSKVYQKMRTDSPLTLGHKAKALGVDCDFSGPRGCFPMKPVYQLDLSGLHVLDGGMATELERKGFNLAGPLWSAHVLDTSPQAIAAVHCDYLEAGADCLLTASYQVSAEGFRQIGRDSPDDAAADALRASVAIAEMARSEYRASSPRKVWIAASLGPYGAMLHNGAEYHGNYTCSFDDLVGFHSRRVAILAETNADFLAFESIPSLKEAKAIVTALNQRPDVPACLTFTCRDAAHVSHGERLRECTELLDTEPQVIGIGVNCTPPGLIAGLIGEVAQATAKPIIVYPNSGEQWDAQHHCWHGEEQIQEFGELARRWRSAGAQWIGGCCRTGPEHVRAVTAVWHAQA